MEQNIQGQNDQYKAINIKIKIKEEQQKAEETLTPLKNTLNNINYNS